MKRKKSGTNMTEEELRDAWEEWRAEKTNLPYLEWLEQKVRKQKEEAEDQKLFGQFVGLFLSTVSILAFISCIYFNVHYLLWGISLVCMFWGLWVVKYFTNK